MNYDEAHERYVAARTKLKNANAEYSEAKLNVDAARTELQRLEGVVLQKFEAVNAAKTSVRVAADRIPQLIQVEVLGSCGKDTTGAHPEVEGVEVRGDGPEEAEADSDTSEPMDRVRDGIDPGD